MEPIVHLYRLKRSDQGTMGMLVAPEGFKCYTLELPWNNNERNVSCIPEGVYPVGIRLSPKYGQIYHVKEVPGRTFILIHSGNWAGDTRKGYKSHVNGCILLGKQRGTLQGQVAVLNSRITVKNFMAHMGLKPFRLEIYEKFGGVE